MKRRPIHLLSLSLLLAGTAAIGAGGDTGQTIRSVELKDQPNADAASTATLAERTHVEVLQRQGAWLQVKADAGSGWVRMLAIRGEGGPAGKSSGGSGLKSLGSLLTTGSSGTAPVATGVRGLSEEDLAHAQENPGELARLQSMAADQAVARSFAQQAKLKEQTVAYFAGPAGKGKKGGAK
jgi:hypothetical protein